MAQELRSWTLTEPEFSEDTAEAVLRNVKADQVSRQEKSAEELVYEFHKQHQKDKILEVVDLPALDQIAEKTIQLNSDLQRLSDVKQNAFAGVTKSLDEAERAIKLEKLEITKKILGELQKIPLNYYEMHPQEQQDFNRAQHELQCALDYTNLALQNPETYEPERVKDAVTLALKFYPKFSQDERLTVLVNKILLI